MKILYDYIIFQNQAYGGPSKYFIELIKALNNNKIENETNTKIISPFYINKYLQSSSEIKKLGIYINKRNKFGVSNFLNRFIFNKYLSFSNCDLVHQTYFADDIEKKKPIILTVYDLVHEKFKEDFNVNFPKAKSIQNADHIICISENTKKDLIDFYNVNNDKITVIHLATNDKEKIKTKNENYILYIGSRKRYKNFQVLLKAFSNKEINKNLYIKCFGGGKFLEEEIEFMKKINIPVDKIKQIDGDDELLLNEMRKAFALVYPSMYEGFGLPLLDAMSLGCPVISSNSSSLPEVYGNAALNFDPNNSDELINKIFDLLNNDLLRNDLINKGYERIKKFSWEKCANETVKVYKKILK